MSHKLTAEQRLLVEQLADVVRAGYRVLPEHAFHPTRRWRIDVAILWRDRPDVAVEIDGGAGVEKDNEKIAALAAAGYRFIRVTPKQVRDGTALRWIRAAL